MEPVSLSAEEREAFLELALRYLDRATSPEEDATLHAQLAAGYEKRELFVALCFQEAALQEIAPAQLAPWGDVGPVKEESVADGEAATASDSGAMAPADRWGKWWIAGGVALAAIAVALWWGANRAPSERVAAGPDPFLAPQYIATLTAVENCRWKKSELPTFSGARLAAGRLVLDSGQAEVRFDSGARVVMRGPAELRLQSDMGGELVSGQLVVHAPPRAKGFSIQTAAGTIVDLGTTFGVVADGPEAVEVHVLDGLVELESSGLPEAEPMRREHLHAGEARRGDAEQAWISAPFDPGRFATTTAAAGRGMPAALVSYWNFDEEGGPLPDLRGTNDGQLKGGATRVPGLIGRGAVEFHNQLTDRIIVGAGGDSFRFAEAVTIEALFISRWDGAHLNYDEIFRKEDGNQRILLAFQNDNYPEYSLPKFTRGPVLAFGLNVGGVYSELDMPLDGQEGRPGLADIADGRVHHVVATYEAATGLKAIYLDGVLRYSTRLRGLISSGGAADAVIGNLESSREPFDGLIDEVAIYRTALAPSTIALHWQRVRAGRGYFEQD